MLLPLMSTTVLLLVQLDLLPISFLIQNHCDCRLLVPWRLPRWPQRCRSPFHVHFLCCCWVAKESLIRWFFNSLQLLSSLWCFPSCTATTPLNACLMFQRKCLNLLKLMTLSVPPFYLRANSLEPRPTLLLSSTGTSLSHKCLLFACLRL